MSVSTVRAEPAASPAQAGLIGRFLSGNIVPRTAAGRRFAFIALIDSLGSGLFYASSALYFTRVVGLSAGQVGIGLSVAGLIGFLGVVPVGMLADRVRAGRVYIAIQLWRAACFAAYCLVTSFPMFVLTACAIGLADAAVPPISQAVVGAAVSSEDRVDTLAKIRAVRNIGFGAGALLAAFAIQHGTRGSFVAMIAGNAVSFLIAALLLWTGRVAQLITVGKSAKGTRSTLVADVRYIAAAVLNGVLSVHLTLFPLVLPLWLATHTKVPIGTFGILYVLNTVMAVVLQARFARPADKLGGAVVCGVLAGISLAAFGVIADVMGQTHLVVLATALAVIAAVMLTFGEMWQSAAGWTISYELARPERRAQYLSTFQMGTVVQAAAAPWVFTHTVMPSPHGWLIFAVVAAAAGFAMAAVVGLPRRLASAHRGESQPAQMPSQPGPAAGLRLPLPRSPRRHPALRIAAGAGGVTSREWQQLITLIADFEPGSPTDFLDRTRQEAIGMAGYAEAWIEAYETMTGPGLGADPLALRGLRRFADAAAAAAEHMAAAREEFAAYYRELRESAAGNGSFEPAGQAGRASASPPPPPGPCIRPMIAGRR